MRAGLLSLVVFTVVLVGAGTAEAGGGYSYNRGFYGGPSVRFSYHSGGMPGIYYGRHGHGHHRHGHGHWHDTSHYDFHPGGYERHYNHYHYVPPHFDRHEDGHWDHH